MILVVGPYISLPFGVIRFFKITTLLEKNFILEPSWRYILFLVRTIIPCTFVFFLSQFSGRVTLTEALIKSPVKAILREKPR